MRQCVTERHGNARQCCAKVKQDSTARVEYLTAQRTFVAFPTVPSFLLLFQFSCTAIMLALWLTEKPWVLGSLA